MSHYSHSVEQYQCVPFGIDHFVQCIEHHDVSVSFRSFVEEHASIVLLPLFPEKLWFFRVESVYNLLNYDILKDAPSAGAYV